jgi:hypothetical protein
VWDDGVDDGETGSVDRTVVLAGRTPRPRREGMREQGQHAEPPSGRQSARSSLDLLSRRGSRFGSLLSAWHSGDASGGRDAATGQVT